MRLFLCNSSPSLPSSPPPSSSLSIHKSPYISLNWPQKTLSTALPFALSFGLLISSHNSIALESLPVQSSPYSTVYCREEEREERVAETPPESVTNEGIVEEAWDIINDSFLDTGRHRWSPETWLVTISPSLYMFVYV